jgi:ubiquinone/menaquinone biosynthesis C-methylase UbiE
MTERRPAPRWHVPSALQRLFWSLYGHWVWDEAHSSAEHAQRIQRVVDLLQLRQRRPGEWVLDAGCGTGNYAVALAQAGFGVVGIDYAPGMLAQAQAKVGRDLAHVLTFQHVDLDRPLPFAEAAFAHVISISSLQVTADPAFTLSEFARVLKPGGTFLLAHFPRPPARRRDQLQGTLAQTHAWHKRLLICLKCWAEDLGATTYWTAEELRTMLEAGGYTVLALQGGRPLLCLAEKPAPA